MRKRSLPAILLALLLTAALCAPAAAAPAPTAATSYVSQIFNEESGLPTGEANAILQSSRGYLWIGSYGGLVRYDGSHFVNYSETMGASAVRALFETADGVLFIGTNADGVYTMANNAFTHVTAADAHAFTCIRAFATLSDGTVYAASPSGVARIGDGALIPCAAEALAEEQFIGVAADEDDQIWALASSGRLYVLRGDEVVASYDSSDVLSGGYATAIAAAPDGSILFGSSEHEVVSVRSDGDGLQIVSRDTGALTAVNHLNCARDGRVYVSGLTGFGYLSADGVFVRIDDAAENALSANWSALDYEGNLWVASSSYGLIRYSVGCFDSCNAASGLGKTTVNAVHKQDGRYYVGTDAGMLMFNEDWTPYTCPLTELLDGIRVRNITSDIYGRVWFATYSSHGALRYDPKTGETADFGLAQGLSSEKLRVVYPLSDGRVLAGDQLGCVIIDGDAVAESYGAEDGLTDPSVLCALELDGHIYVGTDGGGVFELKNGAVTGGSFAAGLEEGVVLRMAPDADGGGRFFVCAGDSLYHFDGASYRKLDGIEKTAGSIYNVYDVDGRIWILQDAGVLSANKAALLAGEETYTALYGLKCGLTGSLSANTWNYLDADGRLYLATRNGVSVFYFKGTDIALPLAILNSVTIDDQVYELPTSLTIPSGAQRVTMDVAALLFTDTASFDLAYQLVGFDAAETVTSARYISERYTNLPGGEYTFRVRVIDPETGEDALALEMQLIKEKSLTERVWFWVLVAAAAVLVAYLIAALLFRVRMRRVEKHQKELEDITEQALEMVARTIDAKDEYTKGHSQRVAYYTKEIARRLGYSEQDCQRVYYIGLLHDIGKIGVPDNILNKKGPLTPEERAIIQRHPVVGGEILKDFRALPHIADGAAYHHERYDGKGYGVGLKGKDIPEIARIIGIADSYDAMQSSRVYRPSLSDAKIRSELVEGAGSQFDPDIVPVMLDMIDDGTVPIPEDYKD